MADFKTALETLAKGDMDIEVFSKQLSKLLDQKPEFAPKMLTELDEIYGQKKINDQTYAHLKRQINQYRRAHATKTESGAEKAVDDSTVFVQEDNIAAQKKAPQATPDPDATQVVEKNDQPATAGFDVTGSGADLSAVDVDISVSGGTDSVTSATGPTGTEWSDPSASGQADTSNLGPGSVIKQQLPCY